MQKIRTNHQSLRKIKMESYNSFHVAQQQILEAAKMLNLDEPTTMLLSLPQREFNFTLHVKMDSGKVKIFQGYRVQRHHYDRD